MKDLDEKIESNGSPVGSDDVDDSRVASVIGSDEAWQIECLVEVEGEKDWLESSWVHECESTGRESIRAQVADEARVATTLLRSV